MKLEEIFAKAGIELRTSEGELRNPIDILEDMFLKLNSRRFALIMQEITEEEKSSNIFNNARGGEYNGN